MHGYMKSYKCFKKPILKYGLTIVIATMYNAMCVVYGYIYIITIMSWCCTDAPTIP